MDFGNARHFDLQNEVFELQTETDAKSEILDLPVGTTCKV